MLNLTYDKKVHIEKWNIDVIPYLTIDEMTNINESNLLAVKISEVFKKTSNEDISSDIFLSCANNILT